MKFKIRNNKPKKVSKNFDSKDESNSLTSVYEELKFLREEIKLFKKEKKTLKKKLNF
ncbi:Mobile element protein [Mesomycoplasma hyorhinis SK76]|uniref:Mobile element protein n=1 Tax=Mesomycoplasma hyorhinis SK76 TaxID=1118964 RepID=A0AAI8AMW3_MESHY|nr:Mobile element protein [Mesomycoplasma hyorhinis SK76]